MRLRATLVQTGKTATGFQIPPEIVESLGAGNRPPVTVTINGFTYRSSIARMGGEFWLGVSAENRAGAGAGANDELDVEIELDTAPRKVSVPADVASALEAEPEAKQFFDALAYSHQRRHVMAIDDAKTPETRQRRIDKAVAMFREGRK